MAVLEKAKRLCAEVKTMGELKRRIEEHQQELARAMPFLQGENRGEGANAREEILLEREGVLEIFVLAARESGHKPGDLLDGDRISAKLDALAALALTSWRKKGAVEWEREYGSEAEKQLAKKALDAIAKGHRKQFGAKPDGRADPTLTIDDSAYPILRAITNAEIGTPLPSR